MSTAEREMVLNEHRNKAEEGDPDHLRIKPAMDAAIQKFSTSKQLKSAYKIAKKSHNDIKEILTVAQDTLKIFKERYQNARNDKKKASKFKNKFEEGGSGIEK